MDLKAQVPDQYRVSYDEKTGAFRILNCWHDTIKNISDLQHEISDDSPAIKVLASAEVNALVGKLIQLGWLDKLTKGETVVAAVAEKSIREVAIASIQSISETAVDPSVAKDAIAAIREISDKGK